MAFISVSTPLPPISRATTLSLSTLKNRSLCMRSMCRPICIFCLARYTQYGHWNCGSFPHSHFWWLRNDDLSLYILPQSGHANWGVWSAALPPLLLPGIPSLSREPTLPAPPPKSREKTSGCGPSRNVWTSGIASRAFHSLQVRPAIFVMVKSSREISMLSQERVKDNGGRNGKGRK